jgi:hypothetical protein
LKKSETSEEKTVLQTLVPPQTASAHPASHLLIFFFFFASAVRHVCDYCYVLGRSEYTRASGVLTATGA